MSQYRATHRGLAECFAVTREHAITTLDTKQAELQTEVFVNAPMPPMFLEYVEGNYPPRTVISNPSWHAPKLWRAAMYAYRAMATNPVAQEDRYDSFLRTQFDRASRAHVALSEQVLSTLHAFESDDEGNAERFAAEYRRLCSMVEFNSRSKLAKLQQPYGLPLSGLHDETDGAAQPIDFTKPVTPSFKGSVLKVTPEYLENERKAGRMNYTPSHESPTPDASEVHDAEG
ncbi:hypothetical protein [Gemmatimonas sp.]|jgi:hypothetical protein|uniref:hypothetical protein n=1 Tax=Gemmatimonas sp. TaxID=1962908 RepID=UPI0037C108F9